MEQSLVFEILFFVLYSGVCLLEDYVLKKEKIKTDDNKHFLLTILIISFGFLLFDYYKQILNSYEDINYSLYFSYICTCTCCPILFTQCIIDFEKMELSDINNAVLFIFSILHAYLNGFSNFYISFLIIGIASLFLYFIPISNMGFGDVKLLMATSLFVRAKMLPSYIFYMLLIALVIGIFYKIVKKSNIFPMGPAIAIMCIVIQII